MVLDKDKLSLTIKNLKKSNNALSFYVDQNKKLKYSFLRKENEILILNNHFFNQPYEVLFQIFL